MKADKLLIINSFSKDHNNSSLNNSNLKDKSNPDSSKKPNNINNISQI